MENKWYVLRVVSGKERKVKEVIDSEVKKNPAVKDLVNSVVLPLEKFVQMRNGKKYTKERNFYPGYILIESEMTSEVEGTLESLINVIGFLKDGERPSPLKSIEVNRLLSRIDDLRDKTDFESPFIIGETVMITSGPFSSFHATVVSIDESKKMLKLNVKIFNRDTPLEMNFLYVDKL